MKKILGTLSLAALVILMTSVDAFAAATGTLSNSISTVGKNVQQVPTLLNYGAYIMGFALTTAGIVKLKNHVDNPGQNSIKDGLGRLMAGVLLISVPFLLDMVRNSSNVTGGQGSYITAAKLTGFN